MVTNSLKSPKFVQINLKMFNNYVASGNVQAPNAALQDKNIGSETNGYA